MFLSGTDLAEATPDWQPGGGFSTHIRAAAPVCIFPPLHITSSGVCVPPPPKSITGPLP